MPDPTDAEIQAGADAIAQSWRVLSHSSRRHLAKLVLVAVLPDHDARVRADERAKVADQIREAVVIRPGDTLVVRVGDDLTMQHAQDLKTAIS